MTRTPPELLASGYFVGTLDGWAEHLCLSRNSDGTLTLSSCSYEVLAEAREYEGEQGEYLVPDKIDGCRVRGVDGEYVVGERLVPHDDEAVITLAKGQLVEAMDWLKRREWVGQCSFPEAWKRIEDALQPG